ncbi:MAG: GNAT family N-acetyltransferase [Alphaproteobacteria bacterium]|nr:GNAT family N-acetyltransferase [Alphaproteobacteria bacterium]
MSVALQYRDHGYGKILLRETLKRAKEKGINPVLVFHFADNIPAYKMSESVGGKLEEERFHEKHGRLIRKYSFNTDNM